MNKHPQTHHQTEHMRTRIETSACSPSSPAPHLLPARECEKSSHSFSYRVTVWLPPLEGKGGRALYSPVSQGPIAEPDIWYMLYIVLLNEGKWPVIISIMILMVADT